MLMLCQEFHAIGKEGSAVDGKGLTLSGREKKSSQKWMKI